MKNFDFSEPFKNPFRDYPQIGLSIYSGLDVLKFYLSLDDLLSLKAQVENAIEEIQKF